MDGEASAFAFKHGKHPYLVQSSFPCLTADRNHDASAQRPPMLHIVPFTAFRVRQLLRLIKPAIFREFLLLHAYSLDTNIIFSINPIVRV